MSRQRVELMGCLVDNLTMEETLDTVEGFIATGQPHQHVVVNVDKLVKARDDAELRRIINECSLINADGMPVVWASRLLGKPLKARVAGVDLFECLMNRSAEKGWRIFLLGAREEIVLPEIFCDEFVGLLRQLELADVEIGFRHPIVGFGLPTRGARGGGL